MNPIIILAAAASAQQAPQSPTAPQEEIVVTGSRVPLPAEETPVSATIIDSEQLERLALPMTSDVLRLVPGVSVSSTGPRGTQTQLRIRGAEANHTLLFVDGIRFNDPAAGNEGRFELLTNDGLSRLEVVRGPQSALWGSEALGGVVAIETADPLRGPGISALAEYGSHDSVRGSLQAARRLGNFGVSGSLGWIESDGIDSFGDDGERDGFRNRSANLKAVYAPLDSTQLGLVGHWIDGTSEFDGFDPATFRRADTLDSTKNRIFAVRGWGSHEWSGWSLLAEASYLDSRNRNRLEDESLNSTFGERLGLSGQLSKQLGGHRLTGAIEHEAEDFRAEDQAFFGATDQEQSRDLTAFVGEWRAQWSPSFDTDLAVRHDSFSAFKDATTLRASAIFRPSEKVTLHAAYGEGIAQPTFFDLFGFFPGSFAGNPDLRPERSRGWELGLRWRGSSASAGITGFTNRLKDEIVDVFDFTTFLSSTENATGKSRRRGIELEAGYRFGKLAELSLNYTYLDADEAQVAGADLVREVRRPRHSANAYLTGERGPFRWGASLAFVGSRKDLDFDSFPAQRVRLEDYVLGSARLGYRLTERVEAYGRIENAFDADYQDVAGYNTAGRTVYAGLRFSLGD
ncbi:MAG TPA: TonB-dependent receptor [Allosphingosinicella sp.]|nr:TonB-dependent receptor [Allosphingosinicella sp.]